MSVRIDLIEDSRAFTVRCAEHSIERKFAKLGGTTAEARARAYAEGTRDILNSERVSTALEADGLRALSDAYIEEHFDVG